ncbi:hypothetical protein GCM10023091_06330 [Ravibacter arvi]|uniref:TonB C-terminal domain-containing protein n=2 Tax=Ravibacter arvi TaxID=2051041 RepID=A0ABP8LR54_9BACT
MALMQQFISANVEVPFLSGVRGLNTKVVVKGVIEPDGSMSQIEAVNGPDLPCREEAVRVMRLYKAWKPALLKGEVVRQELFFPVTFKAEARADFDSIRSAFVRYFDRDFRRVSGPAGSALRSISPVDHRGRICNDVVFEQLRKKEWHEALRIPFRKEEFWYKTGVLDPGTDSVKASRVLVRDSDRTSYGPVVTYQENGSRLTFTEFNSERWVSHLRYDLNGLVRTASYCADTVVTELSWHDNGLIKSVVEYATSPNDRVYSAPAPFSPMYYLNAWSRDGKQTLVDGDGYWNDTGVELNGELIRESGAVAAGLKKGKWVGIRADSSLYYEEVFVNGQLESGTSYDGDGTRFTYTDPGKLPEFKGGRNKMYQFLASNIRYTETAARQGATGRVLISFVVCQDGTLCDYDLVRGVESSLDEEALRVVKMMSGSWKPGFLKGKAVRVRHILPVNFQMD